MTFTIDKSLALSTYSPVCTTCKYVSDDLAERTCAAFPKGIPDVIWKGENKHIKSFPGDNGIQYEEATK